MVEDQSLMPQSGWPLKTGRGRESSNRPARDRHAGLDGAAPELNAMITWPVTCGSGPPAAPVVPASIATKAIAPALHPEEARHFIRDDYPLF
jgi:hypothetical protein